jgi:hypothetical protein
VKYGLVALAMLMLVVDWLQTLYIARHPELFRETNVILGEHPSVRAVCAYFTLWQVVCIVAGALLFIPVSAAAYWASVALLILVIVVEIAVVVRNHHLGIHA